MTIDDILNKIADSRQHVSDNKTRVNSWRSWYQGYVQSFHSYTIYNGTQNVIKRMRTLNMAKKVCEDWADLLFNERVQISTDNEKATIALRKALSDVSFTIQMNQGIEKAFALGTVGFVFRVSEDKQVSLESVDADQVYPVTTENGRITECAFTSTILMNQDSYAYISLHQKDKTTGLYTIENALYKLAEGTDSKEMLIGNGKPVEHWIFNTNSEVPWFSIFKPNSVNNFDGATSFGISVFANAISELKSIDSTYDAISNEITIGRMRIMVASEAISYDARTGEEKPVFDPMETAFQMIPKSMNEGTLIETIAPQLRVSDQITALNKSLSLFCSKCGLSSDYYIYDKQQGLKTATEVISANSSMYRRMRKHEILLESTVRELCLALSAIYSEFKDSTDLAFTELFIQFDDSIIQDSDAARAQDMKDINAGIMSKVEYRMKWYGEDEATARKAIDEAGKYTSFSGMEGDY